MKIYTVDFHAGSPRTLQEGRPPRGPNKCFWGLDEEPRIMIYTVDLHAWTPRNSKRDPIEGPKLTGVFAPPSLCRVLQGLRRSPGERVRRGVSIPSPSLPPSSSLSSPLSSSSTAGGGGRAAGDGGPPLGGAQQGSKRASRGPLGGQAPNGTYH